VIECYNKMDTVAEDDLPRGKEQVAISARTGAGIDDLLRLIEKSLDRGLHHTTFLLPYSMAGQVDQLHSQAKVIRCDYTGEGIEIEAVCDEILYGRLRSYEKPV